MLSTSVLKGLPGKLDIKRQSPSILYIFALWTLWSPCAQLRKRRLNRFASLAMSTSVLKALPGKLDIKRQSPSILYIFALLKLWSSCTGVCKEQCNRSDHCLQGTKIFKYCTCPAGRVIYNFHSSCKHMHLSFNIRQ